MFRARIEADVVSEILPVHTRTLSDEVTDRLREAIRSGVIPPGSRLVEQELAERLGVSRVPVREAIQTLVDEGIVRKAPRRGAYVYLPTQNEIDEVSSLRVVLERFVVERVIANWNAQCEATLREIVDDMRAAKESTDYQRLYAKDYDFHRTLWEIADHSILLEIVASLRSRISRFLYEATSVLPQVDASLHVDSHGHLIDILKSKDVVAAQAEITQHILDAKNRILTYCTLAQSEAGDGDDGGAS